jgi:hypothetical protein
MSRPLLPPKLSILITSYHGTNDYRFIIALLSLFYKFPENFTILERLNTLSDLIILFFNGFKGKETNIASKYPSLSLTDSIIKIRNIFESKGMIQVSQDAINKVEIFLAFDVKENEKNEKEFLNKPFKTTHLIVKNHQITNIFKTICNTFGVKDYKIIRGLYNMRVSIMRNALLHFSSGEIVRFYDDDDLYENLENAVIQADVIIANNINVIYNTGVLHERNNLFASLLRQGKSLLVGQSEIDEEIKSLTGRGSNNAYINITNGNIL